MKPVKQTLLHNPDQDVRGNCLQACIASVLEMDIDEVPHFLLRESLDWFDVMNHWLMQNAGVYCLNLEYGKNPVPDGYALLNGLSPRGVRHCVVIHNGLMVHDPHPDGTGIDQPESYTVFVSTLSARQTIGHRVAAWLLSNDTGLSSRCMVATFTGVSYDRDDHPLDADDFGRCVRMLAAIPEFKERLPEMAKVSKTWANIVERWEEIKIQSVLDSRKCWELLNECRDWTGWTVHPNGVRTRNTPTNGTDIEMDV